MEIHIGEVRGSVAEPHSFPSVGFALLGGESLSVTLLKCIQEAVFAQSVLRWWINIIFTHKCHDSFSICVDAMRVTIMQV